MPLCCQGSGGRPSPKDIADLCLQVAAAYMGIAPAGLVAPGRARGVTARARHLAYYLAHVAAGLSMREVARRFGRHPTSIAYALSRIEDARDARGFDAALDRLEQTVDRAGVRP